MQYSTVVDFIVMTICPIYDLQRVYLFCAVQF